MNTDRREFQCLFNLYKNLAVNPKKVTFIHLHTSQPDGNNLAILNWLQDNKVPVQIHHINLDEIKEVDYDQQQKAEARARISYLLSTSKYVFLNDFYSLFTFVKLKSEVQLYQLWHGGGAFKCFGLQTENSLRDQRRYSRVKLAHSQYTNVFVSSPQVTSIYAKSFGISEKQIMPLGLARSDMLLNKDWIEKTNKYYTKILGKHQQKKIILIALTYRDNDRYREGVGIDFKEILKATPEYITFYVKRHPFEKGSFEIEPEFESRIKDVSKYPINELLAISDVLVTDYSSVIFDYSILRRPMIFYAPDYEEYEKARGFYYDYKSFVPGPIVKTLDALANQIIEPEYSEEKIKEFNQKFHYKLDGKATQRIAEYIFRDVIEEENIL